MPLFYTACAIACIALFSYNLGHVIIFLGLNTRVYNHVPGECTSIVLGEESMQSTDFAKIGDQVVFTYITGKNETGFFTFDAQNRTAHQMAIRDNTLTNFQPEGISAWKRRIMAVNHRLNGTSTVELINVNIQKGEITHQSTIKSKKFVGLRDIVALGKDKFFATVWQEDGNEWTRGYKEWTATDIGAIVYFDGTNARYVQRKISSPYGLAFDETARTSNMAPTQILRVHMKGSKMQGDNRIDVLYTNDGATISAATSAIVAGSNILLSGPNTQILSCKLPPYVSFTMS